MDFLLKVDDFHFLNEVTHSKPQNGFLIKKMRGEKSEL